MTSGFPAIVTRQGLTRHAARRRSAAIAGRRRHVSSRPATASHEPRPGGPRASGHRRPIDHEDRLATGHQHHGRTGAEHTPASDCTVGRPRPAHGTGQPKPPAARGNRAACLTMIDGELCATPGCGVPRRSCAQPGRRPPCLRRPHSIRATRRHGRSLTTLSSRHRPSDNSSYPAVGLPYLTTPLVRLSETAACLAPAHQATARARSARIRGWQRRALCIHPPGLSVMPHSGGGSHDG